MEKIKDGTFLEHRDFWDEAETEASFGAIESGNYEKLKDKIFLLLEKERKKTQYLEEQNLYLRRLLSRRIEYVGSMLKFIKDCASKISNIDSIFFLHKNNTYFFWFITNKFNEKVENTVFSLEYDVSKEFVNLKFDFILLPKTPNLNLPLDVQKLL